jgi:hypothetical protein
MTRRLCFWGIEGEEEPVITQHGQLIKLKTRGAHGKPLWAYRYRVDGRGSARPQVGGFASQGEAMRALRIALEGLHRRNGRLALVTLSELVEEYLAQHEGHRARSRSCAGSSRRRRARSASGVKARAADAEHSACERDREVGPAPPR